MPTPSYAYSSIAANEVDGDSPLDPAVWERYRRNQIHLKEIAIGTGRYTGPTPHPHDGLHDAALANPYGENLLAHFCPHDDAYAGWVKSGWSISTTAGFETTTTIGDYAYQVLYGSQAQSKSAFGSSGADLVISLFVKSQAGAPTAGELWFGLADGSSASYIAGCKGVIDCAGGDVTTGWKRFYMPLTAKGGGASNDLRVLLRNGSTAPNTALYVGAICCNLGDELTYPAPALNESGSSHDDWKRYSLGVGGPPIFTLATAITNAVTVAGA